MSSFPKTVSIIVIGGLHNRHLTGAHKGSAGGIPPILDAYNLSFILNICFQVIIAGSGQRHEPSTTFSIFFHIFKFFQCFSYFSSTVGVGTKFGSNAT